MKKRKSFLSIMTILMVSFCSGIISANVKADTNQQSGVSKVILGETNAAAIKEDGTLWMWGNNRGKQISSDTADKEVLTPYKVMAGVKSASIGSINSAAIKEDNSLWIWGTTILEDLNKYPVSERSKPHKIMENVSSVCLGGSTGAAVKKDGTLWMWGTNTYGQIGDGTQTNCETPKKIMDDVISVSLGIDYSAAIKKDGTLWMWGENLNGKLGDGTTERSLYPKKIMNDVKSVELSCWNHSAAIKKDGTLWTWGWNGNWQLGDGTIFSSNKPKKIMENVSSVALGHAHSAAIKEDGTLWMWGENYSGQIGTENVGGFIGEPKEMIKEAKDVQLSDGFTAFIKNDNTLWMMGRNDYGQLGNGTCQNISEAEKVIFNKDNFIETVSGFRLGKDNNSFIHSREGRGDGFSGVKNYVLDEEYYKRLTQNASKGEKDSIKKEMHQDWYGSCYGIATSMGLLFENYININDLTNDKKAVDYYSMPRPTDDKKLLNMINYYHLSQFLDNGGKNKAAVSRTFNRKSIRGNIESLDSNIQDDLSTFLKKLVNHSLKNHIELLGFNIIKGSNAVGHAVLVTGCEYDTSDKMYILQIYDENSVNTNAPSGKLSYMRIKSDFSEFSYTSANGEDIRETYFSMYFLDWNSLSNVISTSKKESTGHDKLEITLDNDFKITNESGKYIEYKNNQFKGNMKIHDLDVVDSGDGTHIIFEVDKTKKFILSNAKENIVIKVYDDDQFLGLDGKYISEAILELGKRIKVSGNNYFFKAYISTDGNSDDENELVSIAADAKGDTTISKNKKNVEISSKNNLENIQKKNYIGTKEENKDKLPTSTFINIKKAKVKLQKRKYIYNGKRIEPKITILVGNKKLTRNKDYKIVYSNNKNVGKGVITFSGKGNYTGKVKETFYIVPKGTSIQKLKLKGNKLVVQWKKQVKATNGYQIQYSINKKFKNKTTKIKTIRKNKIIKLTINKMKKKKYYVRIRTYKIVKGKKFYSGWSKVKVIRK